ncbi:hypothetical protein SAMN05421736_101956 [Evansella caseinilytica]|uniref:Uncharacterized protein n=1 Tax=Evansella caseinilytica TaxID=1503961 RepID=A0A1H3IYF3_9BACI|nr:hypothetical protein [Evansella caseinilytica]SDY32355.1 hypothetical protein SAMN05421736_101956 [Evansella caseinilytica]
MEQETTQLILEELRDIKTILGEHSRILESHTEKLDEHGRILESHTEKLDEHGRILESHTEKLDEHGRILEMHTEKLDEHGRILEMHGEKLDSHAVKLELQNETLKEHGKILSALRTGQEEIKAELDGMKVKNAKDYGKIQEQLTHAEANIEVLKDDNWRNKTDICRLKMSLG